MEENDVFCKAWTLFCVCLYLGIWFDSSCIIFIFSRIIFPYCASSCKRELSIFIYKFNLQISHLCYIFLKNEGKN